jgi:RNA polymerase sigma-70 factor (ECF subfamily)
MSDDPPDTDELIRRADDGDDAAVGALMTRHRRRLQQMVRVRMDPRVSARVDPSDIVQESFVKAIRQLPQYLRTRPIPFYPWLRRIAWQQLLHLHEQHLGAAKRSVKKERNVNWGLTDHSVAMLAEAFADDKTSPSAAAARQEVRGRVRKALDGLTEKDREVLMQRYLEQLSAKEIAVILETTEAAIHVRHMRALQKVHEALQRTDS